MQTADEKILPKGTGFITDLGMTGPSSGIIGAQPEVIIKRSKYGFISKMQPQDDGGGQFNGLIIELDVNNKVISLKRINFTNKK